MRNTATRAATAACLAAIGCMAAGDVVSDAAADRAVADMRARVREEERALRASLDAAEAGRDWTELLERKRSTDGWLSPMHLVRDAMRGTHSDAGCEPLSAWRVEWRDGSVREDWSHPDGPERVRRALDAWVPRPGSGEAVRIAATTHGERWVGCDAPATCAWTVDGSWGAQGPVVHGRCWWRFPLAERVRVDLPLAGDGMDLWWDDRGARCQDDRGAHHHESWPMRPIFCNPPTLYAAFDSLRAAAAPDARCTMAPARGGTGAHAECVRAVRRPDGSIVRTDRWEWDGDLLRTLRVRIGPLRLVHHAERAFRVASEVEGTAVGGSEHRPASEIEDYPHGCELLLRFRRPIDGVDSVRDGGTAWASVPDMLEILVAGEPVTRVRFEHVRIGRAEAPDAFEVAATDARRIEAEAHVARADAIERAIADGDAAAGDSAIATIVRRHSAAGTDAMALADELELVGDRLVAAGLHASANRTRVQRMSVAAGGSTRPRARGVPCDMASGADGRTAEPGTTSADRAPGQPSGDPCARAGDGVRRLSQCALDAFGAAGMAGPWVSCVGHAICTHASLHDARTLDEAVAHRITRELTEALRAGAIAAPEEVGPDGECARFAEMVSLASLQDAVDPGLRARATAAFDAACEGGRRALRAAVAEADPVGSQHRSIEADFDRGATLRRAMLGNPFGGPPLPASGGIRDPFESLAAAEGDGSIRRAVEHELARCRALETSAGHAIGEARRRIAHRRVASATLDAVERAMRSPPE